MDNLFRVPMVEYIESKKKLCMILIKKYSKSEIEKNTKIYFIKKSHMIELSEATPQLRPGEFYVQRESLKVDTSSLPTDTIYTLRPISSEPGYFYLLANGSYSHKLRYTSIFTMKD